MVLTIPPELKKITPYVRRAEELDRDKGNPESRVVSYYCRQYAVHTGIALATSPAGKGCLGELLGNLEAEKVIMDSFTRDESKFLCTKFADKIFDKADLEDRTAGASKNTARTFYAAASFLEILQQFHGDDDNSEEVEEQKKKSVYSKWKATEILKAIKEGRTPTPGGYGENNNDAVADDNEQEEEVPKVVASDESVELTTETPFVVETVSDDNDKEEEEETPMNVPTNDDDNEGDDDDENSGDEEGTEVGLGPPPAYYPVGIEPVDPILPPAPPMAPPKPPMTFNPLPPAPMDMDMDIPPPVPTNRLTPPKPKKTSFLSGLVGSNNKKKNKKVGKVEIADATELTRFALAALEDKDADLAADRLQQALQILGR